MGRSVSGKSILLRTEEALFSSYKFQYKMICRDLEEVFNDMRLISSLTNGLNSW